LTKQLIDRKPLHKILHIQSKMEIQKSTVINSKAAFSFWYI